MHNSAHMQELTEFLIRNQSFFVFSKIKLDKTSVQIKRDSLMQCRVFYHFGEFVCQKKKKKTNRTKQFPLLWYRIAEMPSDKEHQVSREVLQMPGTRETK